MSATRSWPCDEAGGEVAWTLQHEDLSSSWAHFAIHRYGLCTSPSGVPTCVALPGLLRLTLRDWSVNSIAVTLKEESVSFGRHLRSLSRPEASTTYGVTINFKEPGRMDWLWYCRPSEWHLVLHQAILQEVPASPLTDLATSASASTFSEGVVDAAGVPLPLWPGRPRKLSEEDSCSRNEHSSLRSRLVQAPTSAAPSEAAVSGSSCGASFVVAEGPGQASGIPKLQLSLLFSNAEGHLGNLCLPVPDDKAMFAARACQRWRQSTVPLRWEGRRWASDEDFRRLRGSASDLSDLLLLGLEPEVATALTLDRTWEKYPRGIGQVAYRAPHLLVSEDDRESEEDQEEDEDESQEERESEDDEEGQDSESEEEAERPHDLERRRKSCADCRSDRSSASRPDTSVGVGASDETASLPFSSISSSTSSSSELPQPAGKALKLGL